MAPLHEHLDDVNQGGIAMEGAVVAAAVELVRAPSSRQACKRLQLAVAAMLAVDELTQELDRLYSERPRG